MREEWIQMATLSSFFTFRTVKAGNKGASQLGCQRAVWFYLINLRKGPEVEKNLSCRWQNKQDFKASPAFVDNACRDSMLECPK
jgi:hypothetical protein